MQTFVTHTSWRQCADALDDKRLGKQRIEVLQILGSLEEGTGYTNHPINDMWRGYEPALTMYGMSICYEWRIKRRFSDTTWAQFLEYQEAYGMPQVGPEIPPWVGDKDLMRSHRSNLMRKLAAHYRHQFPSQAEDWPYLWPKIDDSDSRGYRLYLSKATMSPGRLGETEFLPDHLTVSPLTREVVPA